MTGLHLMLLPVLVGAVVVLIKPQVIWSLHSWQYRHPEYNEPSDLAYAGYRFSAGFMIVVVLAAWAMTWEDSTDHQLTQDTASTNASPSAEPTPQASQATATAWLTTSHSRAGRLLSYSYNEEQLTLTAYIEPGRCAWQQTRGYTQEEDGTVAIHVPISTGDAFCQEDYGMFKDWMSLNAPLGGREVVDSAGDPVTRCEVDACP